MDKDKIKKLLEDVAFKKVSAAQAFEKLKSLPFSDLGFAKIDNHRSIRKGFPEVIFAKNKSASEVLSIMEHLSENHNSILATHVLVDSAEKILEKYPQAVFNQKAKTVTIEKKKSIKKGLIAIVTAGTSDIAVAEEAKVTAEILGSKVKTFYDVGVAGLHRLLSCVDDLNKANVVIVIAGMDGVLPSVVGGLIKKPIIAVPTSCGYGTNFAGVAPMLTMLNSCAPGVTVVNIDNGFGAGYSASLINKLGNK